MSAKLGRAGLKNRQSSKRRLITFRRVVRYGFSNFWRNAWLSLASTVIMTITLLIVLVALVASKTLTSTIETLRQTVKMSIYVSNRIDHESAHQLRQALENLSSVRQVRYVSANEAKQEIVKNNADKPEVIKALNLATNKIPARYDIDVVDINNPSELENFVEQNALYQKFFSGDKPSFASERRSAIDRIAQVSRFVEKFGLVTIAIFLLIAIMFVFNTIRMAIFNRKNEIYMMRLIGAEHGFIRGPFIIEAIITGLVSGLVATLALFGILSLINHEQLANYGLVLDNALSMMRQNWLLILLGISLLGAFIASFSSLFATRKYLKN